MNSTLIAEPPRELIRAVFQSDRDTGGNPCLPPNTRPQAEAWLKQALVDYPCLDKHFSLLQSLYGVPVSIPRPRRDQWLDVPSDFTQPAAFRHSLALSDETVTSIADNGLEAISDDELAKLLLNPVALFDLYDVLDELVPDKWMLTVDTAAAAGLDSVPPITPKRPEVGSRQRLMIYALSMAAVLLLGLSMTLLGIISRQHRGSEVALLTITPETIRGAQASPTILKAQIASGFDGYATIIFPGANNQILIIPGPGENEIRISEGHGQSPPLPPAVTASEWSIVVVAERSPEKAVRAILDNSALAMKSKVETLEALRAGLPSAGLGRFAIGVVTLTPR